MKNDANHSPLSTNFIFNFQLTLTANLIINY